MSCTHTQVVVVGGGIAGLACAHRLASGGVDVLLLEASDRPGGKIRTLHRDGVEFETGPSTLIANRPAMLDLIRDVGLEGAIIDAAPLAKNRWITLNGRLHPLPHGPVAAVRSPLLGVRALVRALGDLLIRRASAPREHESVAAFVRRHFGERILDNLIAPFLSGIYAGDAERLEAASVLPSLVEAERARGSVIRGMIARKREQRAAGTPRLPMRSITFRGGLESLPRQVASRLGDRLLLNSPVRAIREGAAGGCEVELGTGETISCERVVLAMGARAVARLIGSMPGKDSAPDIVASLLALTSASLAVVGLLYDRAAIPHPLDGFGYINGPGSNSPVLGCLFRSSVFPHAAPAGTALLACFVGGARHPQAVSMTEDQLVRVMRAELGHRLGAGGEPRAVFLQRWPDAIPQYNVGHSRVRDAVADWSAGRRLSVVGSALTGVSLNDCVTAGRAEADRLSATMGAPLKPTTRQEALACPSA